jgi:GH15 family glucan-1,4-alpha-glucosidase
MAEPLPRIEDYALIGNTFTAALVSKQGSIDWLCAPRFDAPACLAALLGTSENGHWSIAPPDPDARVRRSYREGSMVLETEFTTATGTAAVIDFMPLPARADQIDVVRIVEGRTGAVQFQTEAVFRFGYGRIVPWVRRRPYGIYAVAGPDALALFTAVPLHGENLRTLGDFTVTAGERIPFLLTWHRSWDPEPEPKPAEPLLAATDAFWRSWCERCSYKGPYADLVRRSLMVLKALTYSPTGGIVAAPTTSLPEQIGGQRNWDYRYCWIRDAAFTLDALIGSGYFEEALAWREWLLRAVAGKPDQMQILYGIEGERLLTEITLPWLPGFAGSAPVRIGNAACDQLQLDVYGQVMDVSYTARRHGVEPSDEAWRVQKVLLDFLERHWDAEDHGLWEVRGPRRDFTHSKVMGWVAFDRAVKSVEASGLDGPVQRWRQFRDRIHADVCREGFDPELNSFVQFYGGKELDAALLLLPLLGFLPADDPRIQGTVAAVERHLIQGDLVKRYSTDSGIDGLPGGEGAFLACSFWYVDALALMGRIDEARARLERLVLLANDVGLLAEEADPETGRQLGNFPQAFSHVGLVNAAQNCVSVRGPAKRRAEQ